MAEIVSAETILDMALLLAHPTQFIAATSVVESLLSDPALSLKQGQQHWPSRAWQGISVVINRLTAEHKDSHGPKEAFDLLLAAGSAQGAQLRLPELGVTFQYRPGTLVLVTAKILTHSVDRWPAMDRICYAQWLRGRSVDEDSLCKIDWCTLSAVTDQWAMLARIGGGMQTL